MRQPKHKNPPWQRHHNGAAKDSAGSNPLGGVVAILVAAIASARFFTIFPPPSDLPDISWRGQGQDIRRVFRQVGGVFDTVHRAQKLHDHAEKR